jgi:transcriptional regulator with GAF, ATPase, and Fis domain
MRTCELVGDHELMSFGGRRRPARPHLVDPVFPNLSEPPASPGRPVERAISSAMVVGESRVLRQVMQQVAAVAPTDATVLITGESGTGKELLAKEVHRRSRRSRRPFVKVNCSAIPRDIFESEFFGHARGAFTGAVSERPGRFQMADGGTIFLDEIGDLPLEMQPKLLRVLQEGEFERVGEDGTRHVDVRVVAATNHDLADEVRARRFRQDLFYRLNVFPLELPPLRARKGDIPQLATHIIARISKRHRIAAPFPAPEDFERLQEHDWPGNIRELQNVIERAVILSNDGRLGLDAALPPLSGVSSQPMALSLGRSDDVVLTDLECREFERANLMRALERSEGRIYGRGGAAELLGLNPTTLASRLRALKIPVAKAR